MQTLITVGFLVVLGVIESSQKAIDTQTVKERGQIKIVTTTGDMSIQLDNGEQFELKKAPTIPLGGSVPKEDPDTFRALGNNGKDLVIVEFRTNDSNTWTLDGEGYAHLDGHIYEIQAEGAIQKSDEKILFTAKFMKPRDFAEQNGHPGKYADDSKPVLPEPEISIPGFQRNVVSDKEEVARDSHAHLYMEVAMFIDEPVWDTFVTEYGASDAETKLTNFIESIVTIANAAYEALDIPISISISKMEIWKSQPSHFAGASSSNNALDYYIFATEISSYDASALNVDHVTIITAYGSRAIRTYGLALIGTMCRTAGRHSVSALRFLSDDSLKMGVVFAHELGHSIGAEHDGRGNDCPGIGSIMGYGEIDSDFSTCTKAAFSSTISDWDNTKQNCLVNQPSEPQCVDINYAQLCTRYAPQSCNGGLPAWACKPTTVFPNASTNGWCYLWEMCPASCNKC